MQLVLRFFQSEIYTNGSARLKKSVLDRYARSVKQESIQTLASFDSFIEIKKRGIRRYELILVSFVSKMYLSNFTPPENDFRLSGFDPLIKLFGN